MRTENVQYGEITLTVSEATTLIGMKRSRMGVEASGSTDPSIDRQILARITYPDLIAPLVDIQGMEIPNFEEFLLLPEPLIIQWEKAVYGLNPHWTPGGVEKKDSKTLAG